MIEHLIDKFFKTDEHKFKIVFTHSSFINENSNKDLESNERLEYLGDSVISYIISNYLYENYPNLSEGDLSKIRSEIINQNSLAEIATNLNLGDHLILGKGEENNKGRLKKSNLCNLFEALLGYFSLNIGIEETSKLLLDLVTDKITYLINEKAYFDPKSKLQEKLQEENISLPIYKSEQLENGKFKINLFINNILYATGTGNRKIDAEKQAAKIALNKF
ncbi:MAG: ribonuclease III [Dehalococcoidia bacterium]|jgi:ribonuclease III|nr:ribonuclease III [Dehalococcoidia bacterium]